MAYKYIATQQTYRNSLKRHIEIICLFSKEPIVVEVNYKRYIWGGKKWKFSPTFFRSIKCAKCGNCCKGFPLVWDFKPSISCSTDIITQEVKLNNISYTTYILPPPENKEHCRLQDKKTLQCTEYQQRPLLSKIPHIFFRDEKELILMKRQYMRNWIMKCQAIVKPFDKKEMYDEDIPTLEFIDDICKRKYNISTFIPEIIDFLKKEIK